jgi:hypothetical protein
MSLFLVLSVPNAHALVSPSYSIGKAKKVHAALAKEGEALVRVRDLDCTLESAPKLISRCTFTEDSEGKPAVEREISGGASWNVAFAFMDAGVERKQIAENRSRVRVSEVKCELKASGRDADCLWTPSAENPSHQ